MMSINLLSSFASFLLENHLDNFVQLYLEKNKEMGRPLIYFQKEADETELIEQIKKENELFLELLKKNLIVDFTIEWLNNIITTTTFLNTAEKITASDIILIQYDRKSILIHFIPLYTRNGDEVIDIIKRIEDLFVIQEVYIVQHFEEIQQQKLNECFSDQDIKENKLTNQESLIEKTETLAHAGYCEWDYTNGTIQCSDGFREIIGLDKNTSLTIDFLKNSVIRENGFNPFKERSSDFRDKDSVMHEFKIRSVDKKIKILRSYDYSLKNDKGEVIGLKSFFQDITEIKHTQEKFLESKSRIQNILDSSPTIIGIYDIEEDKIVYTNWKEQDFYGYAKEILEDYSQFLYSHVHPHDRSKFIAAVKEYQEMRDNEYRTIEFRMIDSKGGIHWFHSKSIVFERKNGKAKQVLYNTVDITELKNIEKELRNREIQLIEAQKIAHVGSYEWDVVKDSAIISEELRRIYGFAPDKREMNSSEFEKLLKPDEVNKFKKKWEEARSTSNEYDETDYTIVMPDKSEKHVCSRLRVIHDSEGKPVSVLGTVLDITSLKKVEKTLKEKNIELLDAYNELEKVQDKLKEANSELEEKVRARTKELEESKELYRTFITQNSVGVWHFAFKDISYIDTTLPLKEQSELIHKHVYIVETNERLVKMFGFKSSDEFLKRKVSDLLFNSKEGVFKFYEEGIRSGYRVDDQEILTKDINGNKIYVQASIIGIIEDDTKLVRGWGILRDITERKLAREAIKEREERYRLLAESVPTIFWSARLDGEIDYYNQRWKEYIGLENESKKKDWSTFLHPDDFHKTLKIWNEGFKAGKPFEMEYRLRRFDGEYHWHLCKALPLKNEKGTTIKWMGTSTDMNVQKRFSEILEEKNKELARLNNDLDNFIYSASHDLKGPINNMEGLLKELNAGLDKEQDADNTTGFILNMMNDSISKFRKNLLELIEVTKARQRGEEDVKENYLFDTLKEVESMIGDLIEKSGAHITADFQECSRIKFSSKNLQSIIYNLISNAIKYRSKERPVEITIKTQKMKDYILLSVQDNGIGFEEEQIDKVFSEYKRFRSEIEGSGVGLFIIKRIIDSAGGKIELESEKGQGSLFKVYFRREL